MRNTSVISSKLWRQRGGRGQNQFEAIPFRLEGKVRHKNGSLWEQTTLIILEMSGVLDRVIGSGVVVKD